MAEKAIAPARGVVLLCLCAFLGMMLSMNEARAATLHLCPDGQGDLAHRTAVVMPDGRQFTVGVAGGPVPNACRSVALPLPIESVIAIRPVSDDVAKSLNAGTILQKAEVDGRAVITEVAGTGEQAERIGRTLIPFGENLLPAMRMRPFGVEERVRHRVSDGVLTVQCSAGSRPAGLLLSGPWRLPRARLALEVEASGAGRFSMQVIDAASMKAGAARELGMLETGAVQALTLPSDAFDPAAWRAFALVCPSRPSKLEIQALRVHLQPRADVPAPARSAWVWEPQQWQQHADRVFAHAERYGVRDLFISVPFSEGSVAYPDRLATFIRAASMRGIGIWSVLGDPRMVLPDEHAATVVRARGLAAYNAAVPADARLRGIQFDIEHYLIPGYPLDADRFDHQYLQLAKKLRSAASGLTLDFVVPFWWSEKHALMNGIVPFADVLTVMNYRTDPGEIVRFAAPLLDWGGEHRKEVRIALEAGPIAIEQQVRYEAAGPAEAGELWLVKLEQLQVLVLLDAPRPNPLGPAFRKTGSRTLDGSATTFSGSPQRLVSLLPMLEKHLSAWDAFSGIALHELTQDVRPQDDLN